MSSYLKLINGIEGIATTMLPDLNVYKGTVDQISRQIIPSEKPMIGIQEGFIIKQSEVDSNTKSGTLLIDFGLKDATDSTSQETQNIVASVDVLIDQFLNELHQLYSIYGIEISNIQRAPWYKKTSATYSGMLLSFDFQIGVCDVNIFPDMATYQNYIGRKISPFKWYGITENTSV